MNTPEQKIHALPDQLRKEVVKVKFRVGGRQKKNPQIIPSPVEVPEQLAEHKRPQLRVLKMFDDEGQPLRTGLFVKYDRTGKKLPGYYIRPFVDGKQWERKLDATTQGAAITEVGDWNRKISLFKVGHLATNPLLDDTGKTLEALCQLYIDAGCPFAKGVIRIGKNFEREVRRVQMIAKWPMAKFPAKQANNLEACKKYDAWRVKQISRKGNQGHRQVDIELVTLSNLFTWAARNQTETGIEKNLISEGRPRFQHSENVEHCREWMPRDADELHKLARYLFESTKTEVYGWAVLFQAMIGHRATALFTLRMDAKTKREPGYISGSKLYLFRSHSHKGTRGHIDIYDELKVVLEAHKLWHLRRYPGGPRDPRHGSPWFFPAPSEPSKQIRVDCFTPELQAAAASLELGKRTSHGLRAYRENVLRSQGMEDQEIALMNGQKTLSLVVNVYGEGLDQAIGYIPAKVIPAWDKYLPEKLKTGIRAEQIDFGFVKALDDAPKAPTSSPTRTHRKRQ